MKTYNGLIVPKQINPRLIISAFANEIDNEKVERYTLEMKEKMLSHDFPPIEGYPVILDEDDFSGWFINGDEITDEHMGKLAWKVTDGHHRSLAAIEARLPYIETELDYSTITSETDLKNFRD